MRILAVQDAGLAAVLLVATFVVDDPLVGVLRNNGLPLDAAWAGQLTVWVVATGGCVLAVLARGRWPVAALVVAGLGSLAHMAVIAGPAPVDLAVPLALHAVARRRGRGVSLGLLAGAVVVVAGWTAFVALDGRADGWLARASAGPESALVVRQASAPPSPRPAPGVEPRPGATAWGGLAVLVPALVAGWATGSGARNRRAYLDELTARAHALSRERDHQSALAAAAERERDQQAALVAAAERERDQQVALVAAAERERDQRAVLAAVAERGRIMREVHDVVAHGLSIIVMQAQGGAAALGNRPRDTLTALDTIVETGRASLADLRHVLAATAPPSTHPAPGLARLPYLIDQVRASGIPVDLRVGGEPAPVPTAVDLAAYRIVQESLTNTMKHAGAGATASVLLSYGERALTVEIHDTGTPRPDLGTGNGLRGMRERAEALGGTLTAEPGPGGFAVRSRLPYGGAA